MDELKELKSKISDMLSELYKEKNKHYPEFNSQESKEFYSFLDGRILSFLNVLAIIKVMLIEGGCYD